MELPRYVPAARPAIAAHRDQQVRERGGVRLGLLPHRELLSKGESRTIKSGQELLRLFSQLSSNKISPHNAFDIKVFENLKDLVRLNPESSSDDDGRDAEGMSDDGSFPGNFPCFSTASAVIEGASRVYGYRVEAIYEKTYKVLSSMTSRLQNATWEEPGADSGATSRSRQRKPATTFDKEGMSTLANRADITLQDGCPEKEGAFDPFFLKLSGMFDEAGARGLLLTHLQVGPDMSLRFDGSSRAFRRSWQRSNIAEKSLNDFLEVKGDVISGSIYGAVPGPFPAFTPLKLCPDLENFRDRLSGAGSSGEAHGNPIVTTTEAEEEIPMDTEDALNENQHDWESFEPSVDAGIGDTCSQADQKETENVTELPSAPSDPGRALWGRGSATLADRLDAIDVKGGSEFRYFRVDDSAFEENIHSLVGEDRRVRKKTKRPLENSNIALTNSSKKQRVEQVIDPLSVNLQNLHYCLKDFRPQRRSKADARQANPLVAPDQTGFPFKFSTKWLTTLSAVFSRQIILCRNRDESLGENGEISAQIVETEPEGKDGQFGLSNGVDREGERSWRNDLDADSLNDFGENLWEEDFCESRGDSRLDDTQLYISKLFEGDVLTGAFMDIDSHSLIGSTLGRIHLINQPSRVENTGIQFARTSRYVNVQHVKSAMESFIDVIPNDEEDDQGNGYGLLAERDKIKESRKHRKTPKAFEELVSQTADVLNPLDRMNCSAHMMFVCLLYSCNEKDLCLKSSNDRSTFYILHNEPTASHLADDALDEKEVSLFKVRGVY